MWGLEFLPITGYPRLPFPELCIFETQGQLRGYVYFEHLWVSEMHSLTHPTAPPGNSRL